jgi:hypothetical protein
MDVRICRWFEGKQAALSFRFDDSHTTHIEKALPILNEFGCVGTFLINPGNPRYATYRTEWEHTVLEQGHELGDHTMNHRGAKTDADAEEQIGECAEHIWNLQKERSKVLAFQQGGATTWLQRKPMEFFLKKYHLFEPGRSMSCSESYKQFSADAFRNRLDDVIKNGEWMESHFHGIDDTHLYISSPVFRELLEYARTRSSVVWQAGMAAIHKYQMARDQSSIIVQIAGPDEIAVHLTCATDSAYYDQNLTLELELQNGIGEVSIENARGEQLSCDHISKENTIVLQVKVPPESDVLRINAQGLGELYENVHGPELPSPGPHPYLFFNSSDIPKLKAKSTTRVASAMWEEIQSEGNRLLESAPEKPGDTPDWEQARDGSSRIRVLGFLGAVTGDASYTERAIPEIETILAADRWNHPLNKGDADLVSAEITCSLGLAFDWLHDTLPEDLREKMKEAIVSRGLEPIVKDIGEDVWWSIWYRGNWGSVICGQSGVAALAILEEEPRAADWVRLFRQKIWVFGQALGEDGSWGESVSYGCYAWSNATLLMDALHHLSKGKINLFDNDRLRHLPEWFIHFLLPDETGFVPFANCGRGTTFRGQYLHRLAGEYQDGKAAWIANIMSARGGGPNVFGFLWCDPDLEPEPPEDLPLTKIFHHTDWGVFRSGWNGKDGTLFALKGGQKDWDHYHHDTNHFALWSRGQPLITDLLYPHVIWGCETEAHNTVKVNGKDQRGVVRLQGCRGKPDHRGVLGGIVDTPIYSRLVGDASLAYEIEDVNSFLREVIYLRETENAKEYFVLFDDIDTTGAYPIDWHLNTYGRLDVSGNSITISQEDAAVDVDLISPTKFEHAIETRTLEEAGAPEPFHGVEDIKTLRIRPDEEKDRTFFLSVLSPRGSQDPKQLHVESLIADNAIGVRIVQNDVEDFVLFALEDPEAEHQGITFVGRTAFVRRVDDEITNAALHSGQSLTVEGNCLFETDGCGHAVMNYGDDGTEIDLDLYGCTHIKVGSKTAPTTVVVDGATREFEYDAETQLVTLDIHTGRKIRLVV